MQYFPSEYEGAVTTRPDGPHSLAGVSFVLRIFTPFVGARYAQIQRLAVGIFWRNYSLSNVVGGVVNGSSI